MNDMRIVTPKDLVRALLSGLVCQLCTGSDDRNLGTFLGRVTGVVHEDESGRSYNITMQIHKMNHGSLRWEPTGEVIEAWKRWGNSDEYLEIMSAQKGAINFYAYNSDEDLEEAVYAHEQARQAAEGLEAAYVENNGHPSGAF